MRRVFGNVVERMVCPLMILVLWYGPRIVHWVEGYPTQDEQLVVAVMTGNREEVGQMLREGASVNGKNEVGFTPLIAAARGNNLELAKRLIDLGAEIDAVDDNGETALMWATETGHRQMAQLLLAHGADGGRRNSAGRSPHELCARRGCGDF